MRELKLLTGRRVVIASPSTTIRGTVESATRAFVTLTAAVSLDRPEPVDIVGFVLLPVAQISYVQVVE